MRAAFAKTLAELADADPRILLLTGDLGYMALEPSLSASPTASSTRRREQNMVGVATGSPRPDFSPSSIRS